MTARQLNKWWLLFCTCGAAACVGIYSNSMSLVLAVSFGFSALECVIDMHSGSGEK